MPPNHSEGAVLQIRAVPFPLQEIVKRHWHNSNAPSILMAQYPLLTYKPSPAPSLGLEMPFWPVVCSETDISPQEYTTAVRKFNNESLWKILIHHEYSAEELKHPQVKNLNQYRYKDLAGACNKKPLLARPEKGNFNFVKICNNSANISNYYKRSYSIIIIFLK